MHESTELISKKKQRNIARNTVLTGIFYHLQCLDKQNNFVFSLHRILFIAPTLFDSLNIFYYGFVTNGVFDMQISRNSDNGSIRLLNSITNKFYLLDIFEAHKVRKIGTVKSFLMIRLHIRLSLIQLARILSTLTV